MNKKAYLAPEMEQIAMELGNMLATSERISVFTDTKVNASESLSNERRGWGDLWNNENE